MRDIKGSDVVAATIAISGKMRGFQSGCGRTALSLAMNMQVMLLVSNDPVFRE